MAHNEEIQRRIDNPVQRHFIVWVDYSYTEPPTVSILTWKQADTRLKELRKTDAAYVDGIADALEAQGVYKDKGMCIQWKIWDFDNGWIDLKPEEKSDAK